MARVRSGPVRSGPDRQQRPTTPRGSRGRLDDDKKGRDTNTGRENEQHGDANKKGGKTTTRRNGQGRHHGRTTTETHTTTGRGLSSAIRFVGAARAPQPLTLRPFCSSRVASLLLLVVVLRRCRVAQHLVQDFRAGAKRRGLREVDVRRGEEVEDVVAGLQEPDCCEGGGGGQGRPGEEGGGALGQRSGLVQRGCGRRGGGWGEAARQSSEDVHSRNGARHQRGNTAGTNATDGRQRFQPSSQHEEGEDEETRREKEEGQWRTDDLKLERKERVESKRLKLERKERGEIRKQESRGPSPIPPKVPPPRKEKRKEKRERERKKEERKEEQTANLFARCAATAACGT